ncbi:hypothetical protein G6F61_013958 [Rhizopus arrhizus]|nr:hypothetical protein G6F61_013958 [Rhizopus arrhizus]
MRAQPAVVDHVQAGLAALAQQGQARDVGGRVDAAGVDHVGAAHPGELQALQRHHLQVRFGEFAVQERHVQLAGLQALEQVQPAAGQRVGGQDGGGGRFGIEHGARVTQQAVDVILAEGLAGQAGDAFVVRHHVAAQRVGDGLAVAAGHHAAAHQPQSGSKM